jgi:hypothetical protein
MVLFVSSNPGNNCPRKRFHFLTLAPEPLPMAPKASVQRRPNRLSLSTWRIHFSLSWFPSQLSQIASSFQTPLCRSHFPVHLQEWYLLSATPHSLRTALYTNTFCLLAVEWGSWNTEPAAKSHGFRGCVCLSTLVL